MRSSPSVQLFTLTRSCCSFRCKLAEGWLPVSLSVCMPAFVFLCVRVCVLKVPDTRCLEWRGSGAGAMKGRGQREGTRTETTHTYTLGTFPSLSNTFPHSASPGHLLQHTLKQGGEKTQSSSACQTAAAGLKTESECARACARLQGGGGLAKMRFFFFS